MSSKRVSQLQIGIALIFAGIILLSSYLMKGSEYAEIIMFVIIAMWFIPFSYLANIKSKAQKSKCC